MNSNPAAQKTLYFLFCLAVVILFVAFKIEKYNLFYYTTDLFSALQNTKTWLQGYPLLWENRYGNTAGIHNYYIAFLFTPLTELAGAKGLFFGHGLILLGAVASFIYYKDTFIRTNFLTCFIIVCLFALGPYSFWLFDNVIYGWFFDLLFLPLCLLFAMALRLNKMWMLILSGTLLVITKEDGPVIACCIALFSAMVSQKKSLSTTETIWNLFKITCFWFLIFLLSMLLIYYANNFHPTKLNSSFEMLKRHSRYDIAEHLKSVLINFLIMLIPLSAVFVTFFKPKYFFYLCLSLIPLIIIGLISGFAYLPEKGFSLTWTARFSQIMGLFLACSVLCMQPHQMHNWILSTFRKKIYLVTFALSISFFQVLALRKARKYDFVKEIWPVYHGILPENITVKQAEMMRCIAGQTPVSAVVMIPDNFYNLFEYHDYAWYDRYENTPKEPDLVVFWKKSDLSTIKIEPDLYDIHFKENLFIALRKNCGFTIDACNSAE